MPVGCTVVTAGHISAVKRVLVSGQISPGAVCREFEAKFAAMHGAEHGLFVNSGTDALRIALLALKELHCWPDKSAVYVPASTFVATANVVLQADLTPQLMDVSMYDSLLNVDMVERYLITSPEKPVCIIPVHLFGKICDMDRLTRLQKQYGFRILEDSCESMGVGRLYGDVACYSTYVCHLISTGVGGLSITNNTKLDSLMRSYANHGRDASHIPGYRNGKMESRFKFDRIGYSSRATEMQAAIGLVELRNLRKSIRRRQKIARDLIGGLEGLPFLVLPHYLEQTPHAFMMFPIVAKTDKRKLCGYLENRGIETRDWLSLVGQPCYEGILEMEFLSVAKGFRRQGFYIGCHPGMTDADVDYVIRVFRGFTKRRM